MCERHDTACCAIGALVITAGEGEGECGFRVDFEGVGCVVVHFVKI